MSILTLKHPHFTIDVELADPRMEVELIDTFDATAKRYGPGNLTTTYSLSDSYLEFLIWNRHYGYVRITDMASAIQPVLFENVRYVITIIFHTSVVKASVYSRVRGIADRLMPRNPLNGPLTSTAEINFGNEPGYFDLILDYTFDTISKSVLFTLEVFCAKLDFRRDFPLLVNDIERIYPKLVVDYLKKTYHHFGISEHEDSADILWWTIFSNLFNNILTHLKVIVEKPYKKIGNYSIKKRASAIKQPKGTLQQKLERFEGEPGRFFDVRSRKPMEDNYENRFVKHILNDILAHFDRIYLKVRADSSNSKMTGAYKAQLEFAGKAMRALLEHPLLQSVKDHKGAPQQSLIFQYQAGYAGLMKDWNALKKGYMPLIGVYDIELKDIAYLYQIWCFLGLIRLLEKLTGVKPEISNLPQMNPSAFRLMPEKGVQSRVTFNCHNGQVVELYQEMRYTDDFQDTNTGSLEHDVCPDIIMQIGKKDQPRDLYMTFLFDAKYRVRDSAKYRGIEEPRIEDLRQVSTYRDVIFNRQGKEGSYEYTTEIAGAYILFPGKGDAAIYERYYKEIILITNKGGFPFSPGDDADVNLLEKHLRLLLSEDASAALKRIVKPKGVDVKNMDAYVFVVPVSKERFELHDDLVEGSTAVYPYKGFDQPVGENIVRLFAPYIEGEGIASYYEIVGVNVKAWRDVYPPDHPLFRDDGRKYMVLKLKNKEKLESYVQIKGMANSRRYTQLKYLSRPDAYGFIKTVSEQDVYPAGRKD